MNKSIEIKEIEEKALKLFNSGFNCSQSVLSAYSDVIEIDDEMALSVSCGFGSGMGRLQETCGAVTVAYMVFSFYCSKKFKNNGDRKENSYSMIQEFTNEFVAKHKTTNCRQLLNCDLKTEEGQKHFHINNLAETVCEHCISDSVRIVLDQMNKNS